MIKHIQQVIWLSTTGYSFFSRRKIPKIVVSYEIKVQAGVSFFNNETASVSIGTKSDAWKTVFDKFKTNGGSVIVGFVAVSYANDSMSTKVAADLGYAIKAYVIEDESLMDDVIIIENTCLKVANIGIEKKAKDIVENKDAEKFGMNLAANFTMDPVSVDAYYKYDGTKKDAVDGN